MSHILCEDMHHIRVITIHRPEKLNALTLEMYQQLTEYLYQGDNNNDIKLFLIQGQVDFFTAGHDLRDFMHGEPLSVHHPTVHFLHQLIDLKKPLIAAVSGVAIGIGTTMLLHCDMVFAGDNAHFQLPFTKMNLVPEAGASLLLPMYIGHQKASELLLLGEPFYAKEALTLSLINEITIPEKTNERAMEAAKKMAEQSRDILIKTKALMKPNQETLKQYLNRELEEFRACLETADTQQKIQSILQK